MANQVGQRLAFQNAVNCIKRAGLNPGRAVLSQSYLRFETLAVALQTGYKFDVLTNEQTQAVNFNTQQKLNLQDAFVCSSVGFYYAVPTSNVDTKFRLLTYPTFDANNFTTAAFAKDALSLYNGIWQLTINQRTVVTAWDLQRHLYIPPTQSSSYTTVKAAATTAFVAPEHANDDFYDGSSSGQFPCEPNLTFAGNNKHDFTLTLPAGIATVPNAFTRIVCVLRGILAQNVTSING